MTTKSEENKKEKKSKKVKKESAIVTKESICATCAMFFFLGFLILCTRSLIFGDFGGGVNDVLLGAFGYMSYPLFLGATYLCVMGLVGKSLVKNKKAGWLLGIALVCLAITIHIALTYQRFDEEGYLNYCFASGAAFPKTTVTGLLGGAIAYGVSQLITQTGSLVVFALLFTLFGYISFTVLKKGVNTKEDNVKSEGEAPSMEIPLSNDGGIGGNVENTAAQQPNVIHVTTGNDGQASPTALGQNANGYTADMVAQRPGVKLYEASQNSAANANQTNGFSPFGNSQQSTQPIEVEPTDDLVNSYEKSRAFLFGGTPAENYKRNLLFDPNANVNKRSSNETSVPSNTYVPSYVNAYENSVNDDAANICPAKVVSDNAVASNTTYAEPKYPEYQEPTSFVTPIQPIQPTTEYPTEARSFQPNAEEASWGKESSSFDRYSDFTQSERSREEILPATNGDTFASHQDDGAYRRHDYMDLFSTSNPNVFGGEELSRKDADAVSFAGNVRATEQEENFDNSDRGRGFDAFTSSGRDGLHLFDDEGETQSRGYETDFSADRAFQNNDALAPMDRNANEEDTRGGDFLSRNTREVDFVSPFDTPTVSTTREEPKAVEEPAPAPAPKKPRVIRPYVKVPLDDFDCRDIEPTANQMEVEQTKQDIISTLEDFKVTGASIASVTFGPTVTRYNVTIPRHISPKKVVALDESIAISLRSSGVNVYPNYEDGVVSIEVPNKERQFVQLGCMLSGNTFVNAKSSSLMFTMGKDVANKKIYGDITKMIHLLVAGSSGSGKSVFLGALIISLIYKYSPEELRLILIDPKKTEFVLYNNLPHLMINEIITDVGKTVQSLNWAIGEMNRRYTLFEQMSRAGTYVVNLDQYNEQVEKKDRLPKIVIIIDELADLMLAAKKEMEDRIQNLTQKARAAGIHLIVATQRPSTDVITGVIKSNLPTRVAFYVASDVDSRVILDQSGAQKLLGKGDFLYTMPGLAAPARVQSAFISPEESQKVVNFIKNNNEAYYDEEATAFINSRGVSAGGDVGGAAGGNEKEFDPMNIEALRHVILSGSASISMIQRKCSAGYNRAGKIVEWMEEMGYISPFDGAKARKVLITKEEFESKYGPL